MLPGEAGYERRGGVCVPKVKQHGEVCKQQKTVEFDDNLSTFQQFCLLGTVKKGR